jgi:hypothetical protein
MASWSSFSLYEYPQTTRVSELFGGYYEKFFSKISFFAVDLYIHLRRRRGSARR